MENTNPAPTNLDTDSKKEKPVAPKRIKPDIEGITIPAASKTFSSLNPKLTSAERALIEETNENSPAETVKPASSRITLPERKPHYFAKTVMTLIFLAALGFGGYKGFWWYLQKQEPVDLGATISQAGEEPGGLTAGESIPSNPTENKPVAASSTPSAGNPAAQPTSSAPSLAEAERVKIKNTETGWLNVRQEPSTAGAIVTKVYPQDMFIYTEVRNGWYKIVLPNKTTGWVSGQYVTKM